MPTARYWRLNIAQTDTSWASVTELAFLNAARADLSVGGTAFASSVFASGREADKAFDKNTSTSWASGTGAAFPAHIGYDHGSAVDVAAISFRGAVSNEYPVSPWALSLQYSSDNVTWSTPLHLRMDDGTFIQSATAILEIWDGQFSTFEAGGNLFAVAPTPVGVPTLLLSDSIHPYRDFEFGGFGRIAGTVKEDGTPDVPVKRRVRLHREQDGLVVREVWSHPTTGAYSFDYIDATKRYTVITYDYEHDYRAVIADNITPEPMP